MLVWAINTPNIKLKQRIKNKICILDGGIKTNLRKRYIIKIYVHKNASQKTFDKKTNKKNIYKKGFSILYYAFEHYVDQQLECNK